KQGARQPGPGCLRPFGISRWISAPRRASSEGRCLISRTPGRFLPPRFRRPTSRRSHCGNSLIRRPWILPALLQPQKIGRTLEAGLLRAPGKPLHDLLAPSCVVRRFGKHVETHRIKTAAYALHRHVDHGRIEISRDLVRADVERRLAPEKARPVLAFIAFWRLVCNQRIVTRTRP